MNHLTVARVDADMTYTVAMLVEEDQEVAGLLLALGDRGAFIVLPGRGVR